MESRCKLEVKKRLWHTRLCEAHHTTECAACAHMGRGNNTLQWAMQQYIGQATNKPGVNHMEAVCEAASGPLATKCPREGRSLSFPYYYTAIFYTHSHIALLLQEACGPPLATPLGTQLQWMWQADQHGVPRLP